MSKIILKNIVKKYDNNFLALESFDFESAENEFVVIVGPSGCGKSTLLLTIAGLETISEGGMFIDDLDITTLPPKSRNVSMVFQNYALYPHMTVFDNLAFPLKLRKVDKKVIKKKVEEIAKMLELEKELYRKPKTLSGGQRQRVAIGRAIIRDPKVFLFDEPLSNLDAALKETTQSELKKLHKRLNAVFIYVTHDQMEAMAMGDRIIVMNNGHIQQVDTPKNIYLNPKNYFVAKFIGAPAINTVSNVLASSLTNFDYPDKYIYCVRPEHITLTKDEQGDAIITDIEFLGKEAHIKVQYANGESLCLCDNCNINHFTLEKGNRVRCFTEKDKILSFTREMGERVLI